jgi:hypothetical protein
MELIESIDPVTIEMLLKQPEHIISKTEKGKLGVIKRQLSDGQLKVTYDYGKYLKKLEIGRYFPKSISAVCLSKPIRNYLLKEKYASLDIVNCHYSLALGLAKKWKVQCEAIEEYVNNRESIIAKVIDIHPGLTRKWVKQMYLKLAYSNKLGSLDEYPLAIKLQDEMNTLAVTAYNKYPEWHKLKLKEEYNSLEEHKNRAYSLLAYLLQNEERKIMETVIELLGKCEVEVGVYIYDGLFINKDQYDQPEEINGALSKYIEENLGYKVKFSYEAIESTFEPVEVKIVVDTVMQEFAKTHFMIRGELFEEYLDEPTRKPEQIKHPGPYCEEFGEKYWKTVQRSLPNDRRYKYFDFIPYDGFSNKYNPKAYNYFKGLAFEKYFPEFDGQQWTDWLGYCNNIAQTITTEDYTIWKSSMTYKQLSQYLCAGNPVSEKYVIQYLARILYRPNYRIGKMMIFRNNKGGTGKTAFFHKMFIQQILGKQYGSTHSGLSEVFGEKNMNINNKLLCILEESDASKTKSLQGDIKEAVDRDENHVRMLYHNPYPVKNTVNYILNTNKEIGIVFERDNMRRFPVFDVKEYRLTPKEIEKLTEETYNDEFVKIFTKVLMNEYDPNFNFNDFPKSETCEVLAETSMHPVEQFIRFLFVEWNDYIWNTYELTFKSKYQWHKEGKDASPFSHPADEIYDIYKMFCVKRLPATHKVMGFKSFTNDPRWTNFKTTYGITSKRGVYECDYKQVRKMMTENSNMKSYFLTDEIVSSAKRARTKE